LAKLPVLSAREVLKVLRKFGLVVRQTGSHIHLWHEERRVLVTVPNHAELAVHLLHGGRDDPGGSTDATAMVDNSGEGAVYKGLAMAMTPTGPMLYATDFHNGRVDVFDGAWMPVATAGGFMDRKVPHHYAPFGIQAIGDRIFVAYAKQGKGDDEAAGHGRGAVDVFDTAGNLLARVARHGRLNAPWGLAMAPANFGKFSGDLLVGNFGDGRISAFEEKPNGHWEYRGQLKMAHGKPVAIDGLWALEFGHGSMNNGPTTTLFFTAVRTARRTGSSGPSRRDRRGPVSRDVTARLGSHDASRDVPPREGLRLLPSLRISFRHFGNGTCSSSL